MKVLAGILGGVLLTPLLIVVLIAGGGCSASALTAGGSVAQVNVSSLPVDEVEGYSGKQLVNAAYIMNAAQAMNLDVRAQSIGVMTAMGESSLTVIDAGDAAGPDSRGLFQQRANGAWGSYEDRMNPTISATNFFTVLQTIEGWQNLAPTTAAHRVQRNADPYHYEKYWPAAITIVSALSGVELGSGNSAPCSVAGSGNYLTGYQKPGPWGDYDNGRVPADELAPIPWSSAHALRPDAVAALTDLNNAYRAEFGRNMAITSSYRPYGEQVRLKDLLGGFAATPGTSNHGWALAVDLGDGVNSYYSITHVWMKQNAGRYGFVQPDWAELGGTGPPEPWHWEFYGVADA